MPGSRRPLLSLSFPANYLDTGESFMRERGLDVAEFHRFCGVPYPRAAVPWQTINGLQMQRAMLRFLQVHTDDRPPRRSWQSG